MNEKNHITLKWGTLKSWGFAGNDKAMELLKRYDEIGSAAGAMQQRDTPEQKEIICQLIDVADCDQVYLSIGTANSSRRTRPSSTSLNIGANAHLASLRNFLLEAKETG